MEIIVAYAHPSGAMGYNNTIPWLLKSDIQRFKHITTLCPDGCVNAIVMGRRTWESLPMRPLPNRINIVISSSLESCTQTGMIVKPTLQDAMKYITNEMHIVHKVFVIGGSSLYKEALQRCDCECVHATIVYGFSGSHDTCFPIDMLHSRFEEPQQACDQSVNNNGHEIQFRYATFYPKNKK